jgi:acyl-CoA thioester hydrolase
MYPINTYQGVVYPQHCDHMGHMNVQYYVAKFDEASWNLFSSIGLTASYLRENKKGMVALEQHIKYYKEVFAGECLYIESQIVEIREKIIFIKHCMFNVESKELSAETKITGLHIDAELRKGALFPQFIIEGFYNFNGSNV